MYAHSVPLISSRNVATLVLQSSKILLKNSKANFYNVPSWKKRKHDLDWWLVNTYHTSGEKISETRALVFFRATDNDYCGRRSSHTSECVRLNQYSCNVVTTRDIEIVFKIVLVFFAYRRSTMSDRKKRTAKERPKAIRQHTYDWLHLLWPTRFASITAWQIRDEATRTSSFVLHAEQNWIKTLRWKDDTLLATLLRGC